VENTTLVGEPAAVTNIGAVAEAEFVYEAVNVYFVASGPGGEAV
jgi:hypothetical protein